MSKSDRIEVPFHVRCPGCNRQNDGTCLFDNQGNLLAESARQVFRCYCDHLFAVTPAEWSDELRAYLASEVAAQLAAKRQREAGRSPVRRQKSL